MTTPVRTLTQLLADVRWQADVLGSTDRHSDAALTTEINRSIRQWRRMISDLGHGLFVTPASSTTVPGSEYIDMSAAEYAAVYLVTLEDAGRVHVLQPMTWEMLGVDADVRGRPTRYRIVMNYAITPPGGNMVLRPVPDAAYTVVSYILPLFVDLASGSSAIETIDGWDDWVVFDVAYRVTVRDGDQGGRGAMLRDLRDAAAERIRTASAKVVRQPMLRQDTWGARRTGAWR